MSNIPELIRAIEEKHHIKLEKNDPIILDFEAKEKFQEDMVNTIHDLLTDHQRNLDTTAKSIFNGVTNQITNLTNEASTFINNGMKSSREQVVAEMERYFKTKSKELKDELRLQDKATTWGSYASVAGGALMMGFVIGFIVAFHLRFH